MVKKKKKTKMGNLREGWGGRLSLGASGYRGDRINVTGTEGMGGENSDASKYSVVLNQGSRGKEGGGSIGNPPFKKKRGGKVLKREGI